MVKARSHFNGNDNISICHCCHNVNTPIGHHDTHFCHCHCRHKWVLNPFIDGKGNDTKIMKIMALPSQCERALMQCSHWVAAMAMVLVPMWTPPFACIKPIHDDTFAVATAMWKSPFDCIQPIYWQWYRCRCLHPVWTNLKTELFKPRLETVAVRSSCVV